MLYAVNKIFFSLFSARCSISERVNHAPLVVYRVKVTDHSFRNVRIGCFYICRIIETEYVWVSDYWSD